MKTKNGQNNGKPATISPGDTPWFIRSTDERCLVYRTENDIEKFPKKGPDGKEWELDVAPIEMVKIKKGGDVAKFYVRPMVNDEHIGLAGLSLKAIEDQTLYKTYLAAALELAKTCVTKVTTPAGDEWNNEQWNEFIQNAHPGLVINIGLWILGESTWDSAQSKKTRRSQRTSAN
jgi:hypothetical protein